MGADFMEKTKKPFRKHLDRARAKLKMDTLFTVQPNLQGRVLLAAPVANCSVTVGDHVVLEPDDNRLVARRGINVVATINDPPEGVFRHLLGSSVLAAAEISEINEFCGTLGIRLEQS